MKRGMEHVPIDEKISVMRIVEWIREEFDDVMALANGEWQTKAAIAKIVFFGSRARGEGVNEQYTKIGKHSDFDIMIIVNDERITDRAKYWHTVSERLSMEYVHTRRLRSPAQFFVTTMAKVNASLLEGRYFFLDVLRDGIVVYEADDTEFATPKPPTTARAVAMSREYFETWFSDAMEFFDGYLFSSQRDRLKNAAFQLHQCVEGMYHTLLLVRTLYTPHNHNVVELRSRAENLDPGLAVAWPRETQAEVDAYEKLQQAYVKARYWRDYHITREQLDWLGEHARILIPLIEASCKAHIAELEANAGR